ncbi:Adaptive-response sensory-kinase SasA [anaerobic digester metagenome]
MNIINYTCIGVAIVTIIFTSLIIIRYRKDTEKTIKNIGGMLDKAIDGSFTEECFDESKLSAVEAKFAQYLSMCENSSKNLLAEKDKIEGLISDISHQTKTPISNILLYSQLLDEVALPEECSVCVKALCIQTEKLNFLICALLKTSRLETGIITVSPRKEAVQRLLNEVREQILPKSKEKGISVVFENTEINAFFDLKWTIEAIYNIVDNAVKYTEKDGKVFIRVIRYEIFCRIDIVDDGIGIAEEEQSRIFTRFYRSRDVKNQDGVGIGLFLAREILTRQGAYIKVSSLKGRGSTFSVFLPIQ